MLSDRDILEQLRTGNLRIDPFNDEQLQPASYDVTLGKWIWVPSQPEVIDPYVELPGEFIEMPEHGFYEIPAHYWILGVTYEQFELSESEAADLGGKSSLGRIGFANHITAGFIDPSFRGPITLEIENRNPISRFRIYRGMPCGQVKFQRLSSPTENGYKGRYSQAFMDDRPQPSRFWVGRSRP